MNSKKFRQTERFLRNGFETSGEWGFPLIKKQSLDLTNIELIACSDTSTHDTCNLDKGVHFWVDDYPGDKLSLSESQGGLGHIGKVKGLPLFLL